MIDENGVIRTEKGPYLLHVGDQIAFPESTWLARVTQVTDTVGMTTPRGPTVMI